MSHTLGIQQPPIIINTFKSVDQNLEPRNNLFDPRHINNKIYRIVRLSSVKRQIHCSSYLIRYALCVCRKCVQFHNMKF